MRLHSRLARIRKAEQRLQVKDVYQIILAWSLDDLPPLKPGEQRIILTWEDGDQEA